MHYLANLMGRYRGVLAVVLVVLTLVALAGIAMLTVDDVPRNLYKIDSEEYAVLQEVCRDFGSDDNDVLVVIEADDLFTPRAIATLRRVVERVRRLEGVSFVRSIDGTVVFETGRPARSLLPPPDAPQSAYEQARRDALSHPLLAGQLISRDGHTTLILIHLSDDRTTIADMARVIQPIRAVAEKAMANTDLRLRITGVPVIRVEVYEMIPREEVKFMGVGAAIAAAIAYILFRRVVSVVIVSVAAMIGATWSLGALGLVGEQVNVLNSVMPTLVLVVGFADGVHLMHDIRASRRSGLGRLDASHRAIRNLGPACGLTSLTTAIGFGSLAVTSVPIIRRLGLACGAGVALTLAAVLLGVPLLCSTRLGDRLQRTRPSRSAVWLAPYCRRWIHAVTRHARLVSLIGGAFTLALLATALRLEPDSSLRESIPTRSESGQAVLHCDKAFGGVMYTFVLVEWPRDRTLASPDVLSAIAEVEQLLRDQPTTRNPLSVLDLLKALPPSSERLAERIPLLGIIPEGVRDRFVRQDRRRALVMAHVQDTGTAAAEPAIAELERRLMDIRSRYPGITLRQTGTSVIAAHQLNRMIRDLACSLGLAAVVIFGVMTLALRSIRLGLLTVLPNVFPLAVTAAFLVWTGRHLQLTSVIVFSVCLGVAVDDTIHFVMRFRRELEVDGDVHEALCRTFVAVGAALLTTTAVFVGGFGTVLLSAMPTMRLFAALACVALLAALVGDLIILPALLAWPGKRTRQTVMPEGRKGGHGMASTGESRAGLGEA